MTITVCDLKHSHPPIAVARHQLHILYLSSVSKKQGPIIKLIWHTNNSKELTGGTAISLISSRNIEFWRLEETIKSNQQLNIVKSTTKPYP